jgi:hypothetical protein
MMLQHVDQCLDVRVRLAGEIRHQLVLAAPPGGKGRHARRALYDPNAQPGTAERSNADERLPLTSVQHEGVGRHLRTIVTAYG